MMRWWPGNERVLWRRQRPWPVVAHGHLERIGALMRSWWAAIVGKATVSRVTSRNIRPIVVGPGRGVVGGMISTLRTTSSGVVVVPVSVVVSRHDKDPLPSQAQCRRAGLMVLGVEAASWELRGVLTLSSEGREGRSEGGGVDGLFKGPTRQAELV